jgi:hypothetical protein
LHLPKAACTNPVHIANLIMLFEGIKIKQQEGKKTRKEKKL